MSKITRIAVLAISLVSLFAVMSATAGATTWTNSGATSFTATGNASTFSVTSVPLSCTGADASGAAPASVVAPTPVATGTISFTGCTITALRNAVTMDCGYALTATAFDGTGMTNSVVTGTADGNCGVYQTGRQICRIDWSFSLTATNGGGSFWHWLFHHVGVSISFTNGDIGTCPLGAGETASGTDLVFDVTSGTSPVITRD